MTSTSTPRYASASGAEFLAANLSTLAVVLLDGYGQRVLAESDATAKAALASGRGTIENTIAGFDAGRAAFEILKITDAPRARVNLSLDCALDTLTAPLVADVPVDLRACVPGEQELATPDGSLRRSQKLSLKPPYLAQIGIVRARFL